MRPRIAIDAMGGDEGPRVMVAGAALARHRHAGFQFLFVGDEAQIREALKDHPNLSAASDIMHAPDVVSGDDKPSQALRGSKTTSMGMAVNAVKTGEVSAAVSAGNTGALMAISKLALRMHEELHVDTLEALELAAHDGRLESPRRASLDQRGPDDAGPLPLAP